MAWITPDALTTATTLTVDGNVTFYSSRFVGTLLGCRFTFQPGSPPPALPLPEVSFDDPDIQLVDVVTDRLTAEDMHLALTG